LIARGDLSVFAAFGGLLELSVAGLRLAPEVGLIARGDLSVFAACGGLLELSVAGLRAGS